MKGIRRAAFFGANVNLAGRYRMINMHLQEVFHTSRLSRLDLSLITTEHRTHQYFVTSARKRLGPLVPDGSWIIHSLLRVVFGLSWGQSDSWRSSAAIILS